MRIMHSEVKRVAQMLIDTPEVVEADRVTGKDCFGAKVMVFDVQELESVIDRFQLFESAATSIISLSAVVPRFSKI